MWHRCSLPGAWSLARLRAAAVTFGLAGMVGRAAVVEAQGTPSVTARVLGVQLSVESARDEQGILVTVVTPGSVAQRLGIRPGDRLFRIGRVALAWSPTDPSNAGSPATRMRVAMEQPAPVVPVLVSRNGTLMTGLASWTEDFVPVPLHDLEGFVGAFTTLTQDAMVPVESFGSVEVPSIGGTGRVPSIDDPPTGRPEGMVAVPSLGGGRREGSGGSGSGSSSGSGSGSSSGSSSGSNSGSNSGSGSGSSSGSGSGSNAGSEAPLASRAWRAACASLTGPRLNGKWMWVSGSGSASEELWLNADGSYSTSRTSVVSSYAEDGCSAIAGGNSTFYKALSSAMGSVPSATSQGRVTLGSASQGQFEPRTVRFDMEGNGRGALTIGGDRYRVLR